MSVVRGRAMISPMKPSSAPHIDSDSSSIARFSPMAFPITFGVTMVSVIICTMMNTSTAEPKTIQKFSPVSAAFSPARNAVGISAKVWRYGNKVENADENAKTDSHRKADDGEADAEQYGHYECHGRLSPNITVQCAFHIVGELMPERSVLLWKDADPVFRKELIVH